MKFSLSLAALTALSGANAFCMIGICTKNGGCTTLSNIRYLKVTSGKVEVDQFYGNVLFYSVGNILQFPEVNRIAQCRCWPL
ncbi:hypothetical protein B0H63DRAFT_562376 [Podospora didyma]|uniref:Uncharacterized protein n=1 Tax=Podospora didyma TaxID=330526 RepID=A0AAE0ND69_9PEZI|nr:hypothetical protein B0H63DRAFT_562376 [Podospora didyma]